MNREDGFTLVELLVVVLIIAVLAAISIASFIGQRQKAYVADVQHTLRNGATIAISYSSSRDGSFEGLDEDELADEGLRPADTQNVDVAIATPTAFCIEVADERLAGHMWNTGHFDSSNRVPEPGAC